LADVASWAARVKTSMPPVGRYAEKWHETPDLARQFDPELNGGFELTQLPPGGTFEIRWRCAEGHQWFMTPASRRTMASWKNGDLAACPLCNGFPLMRNSTITFACSHTTVIRAADDSAVARTCPMCATIAAMGTTREALALRLHEGHLPKVISESRLTMARKFAVDANPGSRYSWRCPDVESHKPYSRSVDELSRGVDCELCRNETLADELGIVPGTAFYRELNLPSSRAERELRALLSKRIRVDHESNAVRVATRFHGRLEVWPDILITGLRIAVEYDSLGKDSSGHAGPREQSDLVKDAVLREVGWEVVHVRTKGLRPIGPFDIEAPGVSQKLANAIVEKLRVIRGDGAVDAEIVN
jgi:hypothetical protein